MYFREYLEKFKDKKVKIFVDMDGVIADYDFGVARDYDKKRPLHDSLNKLEEISEMKNVELYILSVTRKTEGIKQKEYWLDKYAPFFKKENRNIISKEENDMTEAAILKADFISSLKKDGNIIIVIDDDPRVLQAINEQNKNIILLKDTVLVD